MNDLKLWAAGVCAAAVAGAIFETLTPQGGMKKLFSFLVSALVLLTVIKPVLSISDWLPEVEGHQSALSESERFTDYVDDYTLRIVEENMEELAAMELYESGLPYKNITAETDIGEDGSILINKIIVKCQPGYEQEIEETLTRTLNIQTEVISDDE